MSKIRVDHVFTSESVSEGHPDKVCDQISDAILDACLSKDSKSRVACETLTTTNLVVNAGEITCAGWDQIDPEAITRNVVREIGYDREELEFCSKTFEYINRLHGQSPDISQGVTEGEGLFNEQGAGDQGMMFGYASNATDELMPAPIAYSHRLLDELQKIRKAGTIPYLRPDSKSQVSVLHIDGKPVAIDTVVISHQTDDVSLDQVRADLVQVCKDVLAPTGLLKENTEYYINPTGKFVIGGPHGGRDARLLWIRTAAWVAMAAALFPERIRRRSIVLRPIIRVMPPRILLLPVWPISAKFKWPTRLVFLSR